MSGMVGLADLLQTQGWGPGIGIGSVETQAMPAGPDGETRQCVQCAIYLTTGPDGAAALLVRGPEDVLELLCGVGLPASGRGRAGRNAAQDLTAPGALEPRLRQMLERVGAGKDTPDKLAASGLDTGEVLLALTELEVMGLLARGDGGLYVPRDPLRGLADAGAYASGSAAVRP